MYCIILYYTILYYLYYIILCHIILNYSLLYYTILYYTVLYPTILYYTILYYTILHYTILYCTILYCSMLFYTASYYTIYSIILYTIPRSAPATARPRQAAAQPEERGVWGAATPPSRGSRRQRPQGSLTYIGNRSIIGVHLHLAATIPAFAEAAPQVFGILNQILSAAKVSFFPTPHPTAEEYLSKRT